MKIVLTKNNIFTCFGILGMLFLLSCQRDKKVSEQQKTLNSILIKERNRDTIKGFFSEYPYIDNTTYLIDCNNITIGVLRVITYKDIEYKMNIRYGDVNFGEWKVPIYREVIDFTPIIKKDLDPIIEKAFYESKQENFVLEIEYGTAHVKWSYLYLIDTIYSQIYLKDIFYLEPIENNIADIKKVNFYTCRFSINKTLDKLPYSYIDSIFNHFDKVIKEERILNIK